MVRNQARRTPGRVRAIVYAVLVHAAVVVALVVGFRWSGQPAVTTNQPIKAVAVEDPRKQKLEEEAHRRAEEKRHEAEERRKAEAERKRLEEQARKQREAEERRKAEAEKQRQAELKRQQEEEARKKAEAERKQREEEARKQREEAERRRQVAEEQLKKQLAAEEQNRIEAARAARAASEADKYRALIQQKVSRHWNRPGSISAGLQCTVRVRLAAGGDVLEAKIVRGSGNPVFDRSVEAAVYKASPLPIPADPDLFEYFRDIEFIFNPEK